MRATIMTTETSLWSATAAFAPAALIVRNDLEIIAQISLQGQASARAEQKSAPVLEQQPLHLPLSLCPASASQAGAHLLFVT